MAIPVTLQAILRTTSPTPTPGGVRALPRFMHRGSIKRRSCSITSVIITSSANPGTVGTHSLSTSWRHGPNTMTGMPSRLNGPGLITKCADGSKNMLTEFLALLMSNSTIIDRVITRSTTLADAAKCVLVSFDSTMRSNLSVGMPIDLICYQRDSLKMQMRRRFEEGDAYFTALSSQWSEGVRRVFSELPELPW